MNTEYTESKIKNTNLVYEPYTHILCDNVFEKSIYESIIANRIDEECLQTLNELGRVGNGYSTQRKVLSLNSKLTILPENQREFWEPFSHWLLTDFKNIIIDKFNITEKYHVDILYTRDYKGYRLGPHTDSPKKILTLLFYIPKDGDKSLLGTSMYLPKKENFICEGNKHHDYDSFNIFKTLEYIPNRMFGFVKSYNSFHGVEEITDDVERDLIIYDIQKSN